MLAAQLPFVFAALIANEVGSPQEFSEAEPQLCANRTSGTCDVLLDVPDSCAGETSACSILFCLHGHSKPGANARIGADCGEHIRRSKGESWIGVYPQGESEAGDVGWFFGLGCEGEDDPCPCAWNDFNCTIIPNDGVFVARIIAALRAAGANGTVYVFGTSNGALLAERLGANADGGGLPIAGIAAQSSQLLRTPPRSASHPYNLNQPGGARIPVLTIHGTADGAVPYDGGALFGSDVFLLFSERESGNTWAEHNNCTGELTSSNVSSVYRTGTGTKSGVATHWTWGGCPAATPVEHYQDHGAGHVSTEQLAGKATVDVVLDFFEKAAHGASSEALVEGVAAS